MTLPERVSVIDAHTEGEPLRVITAGYPQPGGRTVLARRRYAREHLDRYRTALMYEPRGHADMYGCLLMPPVSESAHFAVLFLHNEGYSTMCGHGILGVTRVVLEAVLPRASLSGASQAVSNSPPEAAGFIRGLRCAADSPDGDVEVRIDTPAGLVTAAATLASGRVTSVRFQNVPSWAVALHAEVDVPGLGRVGYDIGYGGAYYAFVDADMLGLELTPPHTRELTEIGMQIKRAVTKAHPITHPGTHPAADPGTLREDRASGEEEDLAFLYGTIFTGPAARSENHSRHVCVFAEGEVDRSPTGTGVSARAALLSARGELEAGQKIVIESILGTTFSVEGVDNVRIGEFDAIIPEVGGRAYITGHATLLLDPDDPLRDGFLMR